MTKYKTQAGEACAASAASTPKPTPTPAEVLRDAIFVCGDCPECGSDDWTDDNGHGICGNCAARFSPIIPNQMRSASVALDAMVAKLDALRAERDAAINYQNALRGEIHRLQSEVAALTKELEEAEHERFCEEQAAKMAEMARDAAESRATELAARVTELAEAKEALEDQIRREGRMIAAQEGLRKSLRSNNTALHAQVDALLAALDIKGLVDRFLTWPLPDSVCADPCATIQGHPHRSGTTLLTAVEAEQMFKHVLSTPAADLAARSAERDREQREHDDRIRREALEEAWGRVQIQGFPYDRIRDAILAPHAGEKGSSDV